MKFPSAITAAPMKKEKLSASICSAAWARRFVRCQSSTQCQTTNRPRMFWTPDAGRENNRCHVLAHTGKPYAVCRQGPRGNVLCRKLPSLDSQNLRTVSGDPTGGGGRGHGLFLGAGVKGPD